MALSLLPLLLLVAADPAPAPAKAAPDCAVAPVLEEPWTSWNQSGSMTAGGTVAGAPSLILGKPVTATLRPGAQVQFPVAPGKNEAKSWGGLFALSLNIPARVGIGLSGPAWVDMVSGDAVVASTTHGHGPDCSGIRKIVWFDLPAGKHLVQIANAPGDTIRIMAALSG